MITLCRILICIVINIPSIVAIEYTIPKAIVIGASNGMGKEVAKALAANGYVVGMAARRIHLLEQIQQEIPTLTYVRQIDASQPYEAVETLNALIQEMGGLDLLVITVSGWLDAHFEENDWTASLPILHVDVTGFFALAKTGLTFFEQQGYGHLVGFSSIDGIRGIAGAPAYSAAKAFCSRYLEAERNKYMQHNIPITITEICPGWIRSRDDVDPSQFPHAYWVESLEDATREIMEAIQNKMSVAYITKRWQQVADLLAYLPDDLYNALCARPGGSI